MEHLIIDCETMDTNTDTCAVIDFSAMIFTHDKMLSDNPYSLKDYDKVKKFKLSLKDQRTQYKYTISESTKQFWLEQSKGAQKFILPREDDLTLTQFGSEFFEFLETRSKKRFDRWWTRSNTFDPLILWRILRDLNIDTEFHNMAPHWALRDTRSYIDGALSFPKKNGFTPMEDEKIWDDTFVLHDSSWDVLADVLRIQSIVRSQKGLSI
jgi:hypothetical protein